MEERREVRVQTRDEREEGGEGYRRGMEEPSQPSTMTFHGLYKQSHGLYNLSNGLYNHSHGL
jgi:hypothetical protein